MPYKYNEETLPELPNWDKTFYPYAIVFKTETSKGCLVTDREGITDGTSLSFTLDTLFRMWNYKEGKWNEIFIDTDGGVTFEVAFGSDSMPAIPLWANYDLVDTVGTVQIHASDPKFVLDPTSFLKGIAVGQRLKNSRL